MKFSQFHSVSFGRDSDERLLGGLSQQSCIQNPARMNFFGFIRARPRSKIDVKDLSAILDLGSWIPPE